MMSGSLVALALILAGIVVLVRSPRHSAGAEFGAVLILTGLMVAPMLWLAGLA